MKNPVWLLKWILKAAIFFTLFAFALNNQQEASVHFFFGNQWRSPMVLIVLAAFAVGLVVGALGMAPWWWRHRNAVLRDRSAGAVTEVTAKPPESGAPHGI
ncbi:MAG: LapA family protein [Rhodoferax sp.]|jgi:putative membrane protein|nr:LapA family protein [Rhodoferax sp.]